jgi:GR25 family glycosyltransferase involved in LPS biosynthesis
MQTFVINLDSRKDRLDFTAEQLKDISWERFPAFNGYNTSIEDFALKGYTPLLKWKDPLMDNRVLTDTEIATAISHYQLWEKSAANDENILILEDDNIYNGQLNIKEIDHLLETYDLVYLDYREQFKDKIIVIDDKFEIPYYPYCTNSYAISSRLAKRIINSKYCDYIIPVDEFLPLINGVNYNETCINHRKQYLELQEIHKDLIGIKTIAYKNPVFTQVSREVLGSDIENGIAITKKSNIIVHVVTVATDITKLTYLEKSSSFFAIDYVNLGEGVKWNGGEMSIYADVSGGGQKVNLVKAQLEKYDDYDIILFVDGYDVFFAHNLDEIINRFLSFNCDILFAGEIFCWPDQSLSPSFVANTKYKHLNSGCYIGYTKDLKKIMQNNINDSDDDQLYFHHQYINNKLNTTLKIEIDVENYIFQCLSGAIYDIDIMDNGQIVNVNTNCCPCIVHGNGGPLDKTIFNNLFDHVFN